MSLPLIYCKETRAKGRGIFAAVDIAEKSLIEKCPVIVMASAAEINLVTCTSLTNYAFRWLADNKSIAIALGYGSLYNHSSTCNAMYKMREHERTIEIIALRTIRQDEEITISYVGAGNKDAKTWFKDKGIVYLD